MASQVYPPVVSASPEDSPDDEVTCAVHLLVLRDKRWFELRQAHAGQTAEPAVDLHRQGPIR